MRNLCVVVLLTILTGVGVLLIVSKAVPSDVKKSPAFKYRPLIKSAAKDTFKNERYLSLFAAQVMQESAWNCKAYSRFAGGCSQFTPSTAKWAAKSFCRGLGRPDVEDPKWALPCMVRYNYWLSKRIKAYDECELMSMILSSYNGGLGNLYKDQKITKSKKQNPKKWWFNVEHNSNRAKWAFKENRDYPVRIIKKWQRHYLSIGYGGSKVCAY